MGPPSPCLQIAVSICAVTADLGSMEPRSVHEAPRQTGANGTLLARQVPRGAFAYVAVFKTGPALDPV